MLMVMAGAAAATDGWSYCCDDGWNHEPAMAAETVFLYDGSVTQQSLILELELFCFVFFF